MRPATAAEQMVCRIADEVDASGVTVLGSFTPLAYAAYMLAKLTHARDATLIGFNAVGIEAVQLSLTGSEAAIYKGASSHWSFGLNTATVHLGGRGLVECISPAQIDGGGAFNLSCIGEYAHPRTRLPGGAGSPEVVQHYRRIIAYFGRHDRRSLVGAVDFRTGRRSPVDAEQRARLGLAPGPILIVTPLCVMIKETDDEPFALQTLSGQATVEQVLEQTGFEVRVPDRLGRTREPRDEELQLLRERIDPSRTIEFDFLEARARRAQVNRLLRREWEAALEAAGARGD